MPIRIQVTDPQTDKITALEVDTTLPIEDLKALIEVEVRFGFHTLSFKSL